MRGPFLALLSAGVALAAVTGPPTLVRADVLDDYAMTSVTDAAFAQWRMQHAAGRGWVGLQGDVSACYRRLAPRSPQAKLAYCVALDTYTRMDASMWPEAAQPLYFRETAWTQRTLQEMALSMPRSDAEPFLEALMKAMQLSMSKAAAGDGGASN